jgi:hypothetical protein
MVKGFLKRSAPFQIFGLDFGLIPWYSWGPDLQLWGPRGSQIVEAPISQEIRLWQFFRLFLFLIITKNTD